MQSKLHSDILILEYSAFDTLKLSPKSPDHFCHFEDNDILLLTDVCQLLSIDDKRTHKSKIEVIREEIFLEALSGLHQGNGSISTFHLFHSITPRTRASPMGISINNRTTSTASEVYVVLFERGEASSITYLDDDTLLDSSVEQAKGFS